MLRRPLIARAARMQAVLDQIYEMRAISRACGLFASRKQESHRKDLVREAQLEKEQMILDCRQQKTLASASLRCNCLCSKACPVHEWHSADSSQPLSPLNNLGCGMAISSATSELV